MKNTTKTLLLLGALAGPLYVVVGLAQALTREGFDMTRHPLSMLALGDLGWIQTTNLLLTGALVVMGAIGLRQMTHTSKRWKRGAICVGIFGVGMILGGIFPTDAALGFPVGTPNVYPETASWHSLLHLIFGQLGFLSLIVAMFMYARHFSVVKQHGRSIYSLATGIFFLGAIMAIGAAMGAAWASIMLYIAIGLAFLWLTILMTRGWLQTK